MTSETAPTNTAYTYSSDWIYRLEEKQHWIFYWCQQKIMEGLLDPDDEILEFGVGSGFTANYLRSKGYSVTTLDIDSDKKPDILGNIVDYDFQQKFDHVLAFEILEHIPYDEFQLAIRNIRAITKGYFFLSLPRCERRLIDFSLGLPKLPVFSFKLLIKGRKIKSENHHWELDYREHSIKAVEAEFTAAGFDKKRSFKEDRIVFYAMQ